ncbi:MAG TPA: hypothetical protein VLV32_01985 [Burkholderiales bacterium]|nr:hypothetical protein [Burkholderiales bacterium]
MHRYLFFLALVGSCFAAMDGAQAEVLVKVVATDPPAEATLGRNESFYVRIQFTSDEPISIWARPFFKGKEVSAKSNASFPHSGSGYALGWFELNGPLQVDEVRIRIGSRSRGEYVAASYPVKIIGTDAVPEPRTREPWVDEMRHEEQISQQQAYEKRMNEPISFGSQIFYVGFMLLALGLLISGFAVPAWALWKWHGGWRVAAAVPAVLMAFVVLRIIFGVSRDPTSHNLWPFEILIYGVVSLVIIGGLVIARRFIGTGEE